MQMMLAAITVVAAAFYGLFVPPSGPGFPHDAMTMSSVLGLGIKTYLRDKAEIKALQQDLLERDLPLRGKLAVVTGATKGLGRAIAAQFHALGADLVLPCRTVPLSLTSMIAADADALFRSNGLDVPKTPRGTVTAVTMDLGDLDSIDAAVEELHDKVKDRPVDILVNNAGLCVKDDLRTAQGFELIFGVNFLGTAHFTSQLLDKDILRAGPSGEAPTIISVSSGEHRSTTMLNATGKPLGYPASNGIVDVFARYGHSKLAITTWMLGLARARPDLHVIDLCPGPVGTEIANKNGPLGKAISPVLQATFPSPSHSALFIVRLVTEPAFRSISGRHYHMSADVDARSDAHDAGTQIWLHSETRRLLETRVPPSA
ncbi:Short chain dehydrogenase family protein [Hondaea fermentalgiana]|uniref:Short chain dehydrogenase family protein n=1 Tax=Hondaea fermentalgiana TaxID=2315210 RepID=A0A2R5GC08_9STRA|nr:Short chain dehydrogenase family protein [Hondaea fermentalgiana]|eukprot:GBG28517.1 Short chain dehydrogenase family protein [Hondaea fermentalgiana]